MQSCDAIMLQFNYANIPTMQKFQLFQLGKYYNYTTCNLIMPLYKQSNNVSFLKNP